MPKVSQFTSKFAKSSGPPVDLDSVLACIKHGKWEKWITALRKSTGKEFDEKKGRLPVVTITGVFSDGSDAGFMEHSGFIPADIDGKDNPDTSYEALWEIITSCPHVYSCFRSPSGKGIKAVVKCPPDKDLHAGSYAAAAQWLSDRGVIVDRKACALSQFLFVSHDPDLFINRKAIPVQPVDVQPTDHALVEYEETRSKEEILAACSSQFPDVFPSLWAGEYEGITSDHSTADHQLICILRENCHSNEMVCEMFAESGLYRPEKWGGRTRDYCFQTLRKSSTIAALSLFSVIAEDPEDPSPVKKRKHAGWAWQTAADIPEWQPEDDKYIIKRLLYESTVSCIYGAPGSGKTFCIFSMAAAVATGTEWQGHKVRQGAVLYFGLEGHNGVIKRIQAMKKEGHLAEDAPFARVECKEDAMNLLSDDHVKKARDTVAAYEAECGFKVKMLIIDTLARATPGGDENSTKDMGVAVINSNLIAVQTGCAVVIVHHSGKEVSKGMRGSTALPAAFDSTYEVSRHEEDPSIRIFTVKKQRDESDSAALYFKLQIVELGVDADNEAVTTCIVRFMEPGEVPVKREKGQIELDNLLHTIPDGGCTTAELEHISGLARATLQRRLKLLIDSGLARKSATGDRVYRIVEDPTIDL